MSNIITNHCRRIPFKTYIAIRGYSSSTIPISNIITKHCRTIPFKTYIAKREYSSTTEISTIITNSVEEFPSKVM